MMQSGPLGQDQKFDQDLRVLEQMGFRIQGTRRIRDVEEDLIAKLEAIHNDTTYIAKVQHLKEFYATAFPYVSKELQKKITDGFLLAKNNAPTFGTRVETAGNSGAMLYIKLSRSNDAEMVLPLDSDSHLRIMMNELRENSHWMIYDDLVQLKGQVEQALEEKGVIRRTKDRRPAAVHIDLARTK